MKTTTEQMKLSDVVLHVFMMFRQEKPQIRNDVITVTTAAGYPYLVRAHICCRDTSIAVYIHTIKLEEKYIRYEVLYTLIYAVNNDNSLNSLYYY